MTNDWDKVSDLFAAVRLLDGPARSAFLDSACSGDSALRAQIESLLAADAVHDDFLEPLGRLPVVDLDCPSSILVPGQVLKDRYEIEERHDSGGQSIVYRATDRVLSRRVVVKVMRGAPARNARLAARFEGEMQSLSRIDHPAVIGILDVGVLDDGAPFLVIQYVDGVSVRELLQQGPVDRSQVARIVRAVGAALSAVHAAGIAHQDLKPENIMVQRLADGTETVKLIDFGIAKVDRSDVSSDMTTVMIAGSVRYMAPEQFEGHNSKAADIYALGLVACELVCGRPDPRALSGTVGTRARRLLDHALAYRPEERPHDAKTWADQLCDGLTRPRASTRSLVLSAAVVVLAFAGIARVAGFPPRSSGLGTYRFTPFATEAEPENGAVWSRDGRSIAYTKTIAGTSQVFVRSLDVDTPMQLTTLAADATSLFWWPDGSRVGFLSDGTAWSVGRAGGTPEIVQQNGGIAADLSPDGTALAMWRVDKAGAATGSLWIASPPKSPAHKYLPSFEKLGGYNPAHLRFSPSGSKILVTLYAPDAQMWLVPFPGGVAAPPAPRHLFATTNFVDPPGVSWMPDSRRAVISFGRLSDAHGLWMADTASEALTRITTGTADDDAPSVSPAGDRLAFTSNAENYDVVEIPLDGSPLRDVVATSRSECCAAWIPRTTKFVYVTNRSGSPEVRVRNQVDRSDRVVASTRDVRQNATSAQLDMGAVSPDGDRVAFLEYSSSGFAIWVAPTAGGAPVRLTRSADPHESAPSWSPDGQWISFLAKDGGTPMLLRSRVGGTDAPQVVLRAGAAESSTWCCIPEWSPTGDWIAFVANDGVRLIRPDGTAQRLLAPITPHALAWSHDGSQIYAISSERDRRPAVSSIGLATGVVKTLRAFDRGVIFATPQNPGLRASLSPDGSSLLTTVLRTRSDIWMLEGFDEPHGIIDRFRALWR